MKETGKVFGVLQRVGRAFMLPIAVLPVAGLLLGIGRSLTNETMLRAYHLMKIMGPGTILYGVIKVGSDCGSIIFDNLPLIFAMGVSIGMAKAEKAVAALSGALSFFVMHEAISSMLSLYGDTYTMHAGATDQILGITSLQLGVFGGILVGLGVGYRRGFTISMYQSQNSSQIKSYTFCTAIPSSNFSMLSVTSFATSLNLHRIHLSAAVSSDRSMEAGTSAFSRFIMMKREAFHTLFAKFLLDSTRSQ